MQPERNPVLQLGEEFHRKKILVGLAARGIPLQPKLPGGIPDRVLDRLALQRERHHSDRRRKRDRLRDFSPHKPALDPVRSGGKFYRGMPLMLYDRHQRAVGFHIPGPMLAAPRKRNPRLAEDRDGKIKPRAACRHLDPEFRRPKAEMFFGRIVGRRAKPLVLSPKNPAFPRTERLRDSRVGGSRGARHAAGREEDQNRRKRGEFHGGDHSTFPGLRLPVECSAWVAVLPPARPAGAWLQLHRYRQKRLKMRGLGFP